MKAINYYVVVDKKKEPPKKIGGLELTENQNEDVRYLKGKDNSKYAELIKRLGLRK